MLLDLGRNDVGRVAKIGTVDPNEQFIIERYSHVMHIVSNVDGALADGHDALSALLAGLPAGTVSGAPKVRAMEIIDELESEKRGVYGGGVGYFAAGGDMDICIALRTARGEGRHPLRPGRRRRRLRQRPRGRVPGERQQVQGPRPRPPATPASSSAARRQLKRGPDHSTLTNVAYAGGGAVEARTTSSTSRASRRTSSPCSTMHLDRAAPDRADRLADRGQRRIGRGALGHAVEADDRDVARHRDAARLQPLERPHRDPVRLREQRRRRLRAAKISSSAASTVAGSTVVSKIGTPPVSTPEAASACEISLAPARREVA